jgi:hypothetical protein
MKYRENRSPSSKMKTKKGCKTKALHPKSLQFKQW